MPFELIMLLGFLGAGLLALLPERTRDREEDGLPRPRAGRRGDAGSRRQRRRIAVRPAERELSRRPGGNRAAA